MIASISLAFAAFGLSWHLDGVYYATRPRQPEPGQARIHQKYVHHGTVVFLTRGEKVMLDYSPAAGFLIFATAIYLYRRKYPSNNLTT